MASRVIYGLADQGNLPAVFARVNPLTRTPLVATATVVRHRAYAWRWPFPLEGLAEMTSRITLVVFALVNVALIRLKLRREPRPTGCSSCPCRCRSRVPGVARVPWRRLSLELTAGHGQSLLTAP